VLATGPAGAACEGHVNAVVHAISNALDEADSNFGFHGFEPKIVLNFKCSAREAYCNRQMFG